MLNRKQLIAVAALGLGILVTIGVYFVWPHAHWPVYLVIALVAAWAFKTWPELMGQGKIISGT